MADLLTTATLARWTQEDAAEVADDPFATDLIAKVSALACFLGGHDGSKIDENEDPIPEWSLDGADETAVAPIDVQMVVLQVCKRSYENPGQVIQAGSIGPIGGDRVADVQALFMDFTEAERLTLTKYNVDGDPNPSEDEGELFTISMTRGEETTLTSPLYAQDDQQINIDSEDSAWPTWDIPLWNPGDPGADENYG